MLFSAQSKLSRKFTLVFATLVAFALLLQVRSALHPLRIRPRASRDARDGGASLPHREHTARIRDLYGLTNKTTWLSRSVQHVATFDEWTATAEVQVDFAPPHGSTVLDVESPDGPAAQTASSIMLPVSTPLAPGAVGAPHLVFGLSTTYERMVSQDCARIRAWTRFLTDGQGVSNGATLVVILDRSRDEEVDDVLERLRAYGIDAYVTTTDDRLSMASRYLELLGMFSQFSLSLAANGQPKSWFGLMEDSIFFPHLSYLLDTLFAYNSHEPVYVGMPSEYSDRTVDGGAATTYGGGVLFLTSPVILNMEWSRCLHADHSQSQEPVQGKRWDSVIQDCFGKHTKLKMNMIPALGSPQDYVRAPSTASQEAGQRPLILRQPDVHQAEDVMKGLQVTSVCGEGCFMQRYLFRDNFVLVNGISITEYPDGLVREDGHDGEDTKNQKGVSQHSQPGASPFTQPHELAGPDGTVRLPRRRRVWKLLDSFVDRDGAVWQTYIQRARIWDSTSSETDGMDSAIVLIWEPRQ